MSRPRRIASVGAGAIGGFIGTRLALAGHHVSALARGQTLQALQQHGWRLREAGVLHQAPCAAASTDTAALGPQDLVVVAVKGPALAAVAGQLAPLLAEHTVVLPAMNGVPWWFVQGLPGIGQEPLDSVDPGGHIGTAIALPRVLGCVVHAATGTSAPGVVEHRMGQGLIVGEPAGGASARANDWAAVLSAAGFEATASPRIRYDIWFKLWGNLTMNPVSAITGATVDRVLDDPLVRAFCSAAMQEAADIGRRIGCAIDQAPEDRHAVTRKLGAISTSMLQDVQAGRPMELDAIVGAVHELGRRVGVPTPNVDALLGLARLFGRVKGLYPA